MNKLLLENANLQSISNGTLTLIDPNSTSIYRTNLAFKFYFDLKVTQKDMNLVRQCIKYAFELTNESKHFII